MSDMFAVWVRIVASVWANEFILRRVVWGEINLLAKMRGGNADCVKSFEQVASVLIDAC